MFWWNEVGNKRNRVRHDDCAQHPLGSLAETITGMLVLEVLMDPLVKDCALPALPCQAWPPVLNIPIKDPLRVNGRKWRVNVTH